ncbi:hypothetical protein CTEN210_15156 [Chaetoceros tenuissimus]|uniref:Uncharacterized protein n=1 Tax=Chaetoceros tenuissimus TaxID=426638 RepID=A0AAD3D8C6_9STRA|nr:hypothetical protein CTEN210_15156 [Chaetoceros tenuissimus]
MASTLKPRVEVTNAGNCVEKAKDSPQKKNSKSKDFKAIKPLPPICSLDSAAPIKTKEDTFFTHQDKYLQYIRHTKTTVTTMAKKISAFSKSDHVSDRKTTIAFVNKIKDKYINNLKKRTKHINNQFDAILIDFHNLFGDASRPAALIHNKTNPMPAANITIPIYDNPLAAPTHIPAIGPKQQKEATRATQQQQADLPPGKPLHFVDIKTDEVGPSHIIFDPDRPFTSAHLKEYHPHAEEFPKRIQEEIIAAHKIFPDITKYLKKKHAANVNSKHTQWPYLATVEQCTVTHQETLVYTAEIPSMVKTIKYTPSTARLNGFTLNVLARLHPCWMQALDQLTNSILVTRILPPQLKRTGRVLIDKPDSTDKRPISILHAYDSYIDTIVAKALSSAIEKLGVYDDTIAAYRPGHSCADCTLNHLLAVQDVRDRTDIFLCQLDEDKEKYFDRITTEMQLLPFHLMGFPNKGYQEWIAESLHNVTVITTTPYGPVTTSFLCGVRQGSALSCPIANADAWLCAAPWVIPLEGFPTPAGHTPIELHPYDRKHENPATLTKHSYCDDSSAYITAPTLEELYEHIEHDVHMSNVMSIVTKLSINAKKSRIRIYNMPKETPVRQFSYISWHHLTKTVRMERIPTDNMAALSETSLIRQFGTYSNPEAHTNFNHPKHFAKMHAARKSFQNRHLTSTTFSSQFTALVTSTLGFNTLAMSYSLEDAIKDDHITLYKFATKAYNIRIPADTFHNVFLPQTTLGHGFRGCLTIHLAIAMARELFVTLNAPNPASCSLLQTRTRAMLHRITTSSKKSNTQNFLPHAIQQLALLGIFLHSTDYPVINKALSMLHMDDVSTNEIGYPAPELKKLPSPLTHILNRNNTKYSMVAENYRGLLLEESTLYQEKETPFHSPMAYSECQDIFSTVQLRSVPEVPPFQRRLAIQAAARELIPQYNHLSHFLEMRFRSQVSTHQTAFLNESPLSIQKFRSYSLFDNQPFPTWDASPNDSLRHFQSSHRLSIGSVNSNTCPIQRIFRRYSSPLLFSSDSAYNHQHHHTVAASILMHLDTSLTEHPLSIPPKPVLLRNHILAKTYGTAHTDNNMGESQALTMSLNTSPLQTPVIFLLDSRVVLLQVFLYFHPQSQTIRHHLRKHIHTTSIHHYSELSQALQQHWPDPTSRPAQATYSDQIPIPVQTHFEDLLTTLAQQLGDTTIATLNQDSAMNPEETQESTYTNSTVGLRIGHHLFLHIHSHQLTNYGRIRTKTIDGVQVKISPHPNLALALANTWADRAASRMALALLPALPHFLLLDISHPPMQTLQYIFQHRARLVNTDITQYILNQFTSHNYKLAIENPAQWFLRFCPYFSDPLNTFQTSKTLRTIAQEKAHSHQRMIHIFDDYRKCFQLSCHPNETMPKTKITTTMLSCPFCPDSSIPASTAHFHLACTHGTISNKRRTLLGPINDILHALDSLTRYMINTIQPNPQPNRFIPRFSLFLRAAIQNATLITPLSEKEQQEYINTTIYPPFEELGYPSKPHWIGNPTVHPPLTPTDAHYTHLMGPSSTTPTYPDEHTAVIALLGLLPTNTHLAVEEYIHMITTKYTQAIRIHQTAQERLDAQPLTIAELYTQLQSTGAESAEQDTLCHLLQPTDASTLSAYCLKMYYRLLKQLQTKTEKLQSKIQSVLNEYKDNQIQTYKKAQPPKEGELPSPKPTPVPSKKRPRVPCQGTWCTLKQFAAMPYTLTSTASDCSQCTLMQEAVQLSTKIIAQLIPRPSAMALLSQYTPLAPHQMQLHTLANNTAASPVPLDEIRDIICNSIPTTIINQISPRLNFLHPDDAHYSDPDHSLQDLVLQHVAYATLISTSPALTHEFPSLRNPYHIHRLLTRATTFCKCTESAPVVHNDTNICRQCSSLIKNNHRPTDVSQATYTTCISCDQVLHDIKYPNMPCESCFLTAIIIQNNPAQTWYTLTYRTTPNMSTVVHTTPYSYISHIIPSTVHHQVIPPEEIFQPRQEPLLREQYPYTEDPDFHFQELLEDVPFTELKPFPPRPKPMEFPDQYAEATSHNIVTKVHQTFHPKKFPSLRPLYLTYSHPTFPYFDDIREPEFGHYPEAYIDTNLPNLAKALPYIQIRQVSITQDHPLPTKQLQLTTDYQTIITWSFTDHPKRDPNQRLGPIPESFIITVYPALHPPFQYRMYFHPGSQIEELPEYHFPQNTFPVHYISLRPKETPTLHVLAAIYLTATIPPQCLSYNTIQDFDILNPNSMTRIFREMTYLHAILHDDSYLDSMQHITSPWTLTYNKPKPYNSITKKYQYIGEGIE